MYSLDVFGRERRACFKGDMSAREAARAFNKDRKAIAKMLRHVLDTPKRETPKFELCNAVAQTIRRNGKRFPCSVKSKVGLLNITVFLKFVSSAFYDHFAGIQNISVVSQGKGKPRVLLD